MDKRYVAAIGLLGSFAKGAPVRVTLEDGQPRDMYVSAAIHPADHAFGSPESSRVTVTYGPGRFACDITADMLVLGTASIEKNEAGPFVKGDDVPPNPLSRPQAAPIVSAEVHVQVDVPPFAAEPQEICFCGEDIDYNRPGDEGGEFIATEEFVADYPKYKVGDAVIGHAQCGLDAGMKPA